MLEGKNAFEFIWEKLVAKKEIVTLNLWEISLTWVTLELWRVYLYRLY